MSRNQPLVSACIIARNEERYIGECLESAARLADELVVGDTGSDDGTVDIAKEKGARVIQIPWGDDFSAARNAVLEEATGRWNFAVDCDEMLRPDNVEDARRHLAGDELPPALLVRVVNTYQGGRVMDMLAPRLFRSDAGFRYVHPLHEQLDADGADAALTELVVDHKGYMEPGACEAKERRNLEIARTMGDSPHGLHCRARAAMALQEWLEVVEAARRLVKSDCGPLLLLEGCAMGGGAALTTGDSVSFETFIALAKTVCSDAPDIRFLELLAAGQEYIRSVEKYDLDSPGEYLRAPVFKHQPDGVRAWLGRKAQRGTSEVSEDGQLAGPKISSKENKMGRKEESE